MFLKDIKKYYRINQNIKDPEVRVIDADNANLGMMPLEEALFRARQKAWTWLKSVKKQYRRFAG